MKSKKAAARCPASCGELVQGIIKDREMLVSYPVNLYSTAYAELDTGKRAANGHIKVGKALELLQARYKVDLAGNHIRIRLETDIPVGKGMASSTADVAASLLAAACLLDIPIQEDEIAQIAVAVEPTDSIVFERLTLFDHLKGEHKEVLGCVPGFNVLVTEGRGRVNTLDFRGTPDYIKKVAVCDKAYKMLLEGLKQKELELVGKAASESSLLNQQLLYKPYLEDLLEIAYKNGAAGVNVAHSGTVCGVICSDMVDMEKLQKDIENKLGPYFIKYRKLKTVSGGPEITDWMRGI